MNTFETPKEDRELQGWMYRGWKLIEPNLLISLKILISTATSRICLFNCINVAKYHILYFYSHYEYSSKNDDCK